MPLLLLLLFVVVPIVEIYVIVQVGEAIGVVPTIGLLIADAFLGTWLFRREGRKAWEALRQAIGEHRVPTREVADGALVVVGGALMLAPGFVTDGVGLLCVFPPSRAVLRRLLSVWLGRRLLGATVRPGPQPERPGQARPGQADVIEGEIVDE
jgi:UPF0716 protein FxsA